jgi:hypothetical protein
MTAAVRRPVSREVPTVFWLGRRSQQQMRLLQMVLGIQLVISAAGALITVLALIFERGEDKRFAGEKLIYRELTVRDRLSLLEAAAMLPDHAEYCDDCRQLREVYDKQLQAFAWSLKRLVKRSRWNFEKKVSACSEARERCRAARTDLDAHAALHRDRGVA